jgi:hypothetical protein
MGCQGQQRGSPARGARRLKHICSLHAPLMCTKPRYFTMYVLALGVAIAPKYARWQYCFCFYAREQCNAEHKNNTMYNRSPLLAGLH